MPSTGYDRDRERVGFPRGPRWRRVLTLPAFLLALSAGAWLALLAKGPGLYVVDGDTVKLNGRSYRLLGFDTPETYFAKCELERQRGEAARAQLKELIATALLTSRADVPAITSDVTPTAEEPVVETPSDAIERFVLEQVRPALGSRITGAQMYAAYVDFGASARGLSQWQSRRSGS
jgi:hypothetical protein